MKNKSSFEGSQEQEFNSLWEWANSVAKMNDRCGSILLNDVIDEECQHFYEVELPAFETDFFKLTGEFKLNAVRASKSLSDKRAMIEACVNALSPETYQLSSIITVIGDISPEPLEDDLAMIRYNLKLGMNEAKKEAIKSRLEKWYEACSEAVVSQNDFSPLFIQKIKKQDKNAKIYFDLKDDEVRLIAGQQERFSYYINDRLLFGQSCEKEMPLFSISKRGHVGFFNMSSHTWKDYVVFPEKEIQKKGFNGRMVWGKRTAPHRKINVLKKGIVVKSVMIGRQEWFAMDFELDRWEVAVKACPSDWRLPSDDDWEKLRTFVKENSFDAPVGVSLRAAFEWKQPGIDFYGFSAKPRYQFSEMNEHNDYTECAAFWSSSESGEGKAKIWKLCGDEMKSSSADKLDRFTIRCVKDEDVHF